MLRFSAMDATRAHAQHMAKEEQGYKRHLHACKLRLKRFIRDHPTQTHLVYQVPMVVVGYALRDAKLVLNHIIHQLRKDGFVAHYLGSNIIFISWEPAAPRAQTKVLDYVQEATMHVQPAVYAPSLHAREAPTVVPLSQMHLQRRGPGPSIRVGNHGLTKTRLDRELQKRLAVYESASGHQQSEQRKLFNNFHTHEDAMRAVVARTTL